MPQSRIGRPSARIFFALSLVVGLVTATLLPIQTASPVAAATVLQPIYTGLAQPVFVTHAGDGTGRLFILERAGVIRVADGAVRATPFLDVRGLVRSSGSEQGLLGLAFHPAYSANGRFFIFYTAAGSGDLTVARYQVSGDPNVANPATAVVLLSIPHATFSNHNGGMLAFGPDGYLYIGTGDGGSGGDPPNNAQNLSSLLGKLLRIDVNQGATYGIPPTNPFVGRPDARGEIWALGLRNPWRFSFDRQTGDLFTADVGQGQYEEINRQPAGSAGGRNYQWRCMEGLHSFSPSTTCTEGASTPPIAEYDHSQGDCSVTGGYVYRGAAAPSLSGAYLYGDYCTGRIWTLRPTGGGWTSTLLMDTSLGISSFGEDQSGELYVTDLGGGAVHRFGETGTPTATLNGTVALQGLTAGSTSYQRSLDVRLFTPGTSSVVSTFTVMTDLNGSFAVSGITPGTYDVEVKEARRVGRIARSLTLAAGANARAFGELLAGDVNGDGSVTLADYSRMRASYGLCAGAPEYEAGADFTGDNCVGLPDYSRLRANYSVSGPLNAP